MDIVARKAELQDVAGLIDGTEDGLHALLLEGEAGIGKTTLWRWGIDRARSRGDLVLSCRPGEAEASLPFAALGDLLEPALDETLSALTPRQRTALEAAMTRIEPTETLGRLAVARAALSVIRETARHAPLLIAIDDAQWLDGSSAEALEFILRRFDAAPARVLMTRRGEEDPIPLGLDRAARPEHLTRLWLEPFTVGEIDELLRARIDLTLPRPRLIELRKITAGNPFYALEIGRASLRRSSGVDVELTVPDQLGDLLRARLQASSPDAQEAILLAAAISQPAAKLVEVAAGGSDGLSEAISEGMLELDGDRLRFVHPLLASVAYDSAAPWERRTAHARLASASVDPLERARHLALSTDETDEEVASELDAAALRAQRLGAVVLAAEIAEHARRLTPSGDRDSLLRRTVRSADYHLAAGDSVRGRSFLEEVIATMPAGPDRAALLLRLGQVRFFGEEVGGAQEVFEQVLQEAQGDLRLIAEAEQALAFTVMFGGDIPGALEHAHASLDHAERLDEPRAIALAIGRTVTIEFLLGLGFDRDRLQRAIALEDLLDDVPIEWLPSYAFAGLAQFVDDLDTAREMYADLYTSAHARGDERALSTTLFSLSQMECASGNWALANRYANEAIERSRQGGFFAPLANALSVKALVSALLGREEDARAALAEGIELTERTGALAPMTWLIAAKGFLELSLGNVEATHATLGPLSQMIVAIGLGEPGVVRFVPDEIEALVALGDLDAARVLVDLLEERGRALDRSWALATGARSAALVAAAEGDFDTARAALDRALAAHERLWQPFELARTRLVEGTIERRAKRRAVARGALTEAMETFDALGAPLWAEKAAAELARISGREPGSGELTATERSIAELVATGLSNKEVAAKLFVTVRTVEWNLSKVYAKLGARSRTELASRLDGGAEH